MDHTGERKRERERGYSAAADRVGRQQRRGRGPDPGRRDRDLAAGAGPGPATPHHRFDNSIDRHSAIVVVQVPHPPGCTRITRCLQLSSATSTAVCLCLGVIRVYL